MEKTNDGGRAFPDPGRAQSAKQRQVLTETGMTLRDYFAAKAIQGMLAVPDDQRYGDRADKSLSVQAWQNWCVSGMVEHAYRVADAMIAARAAAGAA
ncbi:hypothetical protein OU994_18165 [Pseudoduganella sp. SL102]|uniref:hypothetical protein n=1 Tax=Pseudoduganella sp. SL102 TaxID=2995154 RepID=UPI00248D23A0|nr:hypothetical protein [Pseudoduganella sp. SL102]WBS00247.1 hypothetical protein OU994_18165 [Pseudoduganella sp. SL102]